MDLGRKVVEHPNPVARREQLVGQMRADEPRSAGDEDPFRHYRSGYCQVAENGRIAWKLRRLVERGPRRPLGGNPRRIPAFPPRRRVDAKRESAMEDHVYKIIELASSSTESVEDAIRKGVGRAAETLKNLRWFEVKETRGHIEGGEVAHFQVVLRIGFTLNEG